MPYDDDTFRARISVSGPDVVVGATAVTSLALALHESATNAVKYGALSDANGAIRIEWDTWGDDLRLKWEETGGPAIVVAPTLTALVAFLPSAALLVSLEVQLSTIGNGTASS
jgi:two-component sensor histidine kinase